MYVEEVIQTVTGLCKKYSAKKVILLGSIEELPTLYSVDIVNLDTCRNLLLMEDIRQYGQKIYEEI